MNGFLMLPPRYGCGWHNTTHVPVLPVSGGAPPPRLIHRLPRLHVPSSSTSPVLKIFIASSLSAASGAHLSPAVVGA